MDVLEFNFQSEALKSLQKQVHQFGANQTPVLIVGDVGTGKTTWAHAYARVSGVAEIVESYEAPKTLKGWKEISANWDRNPVILESIDKWSEPSQASFAYFVKDNKKTFKKLIATSSSRLLGRVREGQFRSDVYYVLSIQKVELPKLVDCLDDLSAITSFWIEVSSLMLGKLKPELTQNALRKLLEHKWQGHFAELVNVVERAIHSALGQIAHHSALGQIAEHHIRFDQWRHDNSDLEAGLTLAEVEKKLIMQTLNLTAQNKSQAARILGISIRTLRNKLNEYRQEGSYELI